MLGRRAAVVVVREGFGQDVWVVVGEDVVDPRVVGCAGCGVGYKGEEGLEGGLFLWWLFLVLLFWLEG